MNRHTLESAGRCRGALEIASHVISQCSSRGGHVTFSGGAWQAGLGHCFRSLRPYGALCNAAVPSTGCSSLRNRLRLSMLPSLWMAGCRCTSACRAHCCKVRMAREIW